MSESQPTQSLGLNGPSETRPSEDLPAPESLQFQKAEVLAEAAEGSQTCNACKRNFAPPYFHVNGLVVCPQCASAIESNQKAPPHTSLVKAFFYGLGAAIAGSALYAAVAIIAGLELALIAILIGYMVGKAIRYASGGLGGRPQQILAVLLTYFAITSSYIPVFLHETATHVGVSLAQALVTLVLLALAAPFMSLTDFSGIISLVIIFFGLQRAWRMTARSELVVTGPYAG